MSDNTREIIESVVSAFDDAAALNDQAEFKRLSYALRMLLKASGFRAAAAQLRADGEIDKALEAERWAEQSEELALG